MPTIRDITIEHLEIHKYDGLFRPDQCSCKLDDLMPCGDASFACEAGVFVDGPCVLCGPNKLCTFHIGHR